MATENDTVTEANPMPFMNEAQPGLGVHSRLLEEQRSRPGMLQDDSAENPVRDKESFRITQSDSR